MHSTRRHFLGSFGLLGAAVLLGRGLAACSESQGEAVGESNDALVTCGPATIGTNHGHALTVPAEDVAAGVEKTYSIKGTSSHDHLVTITAAQFALLAGGGSISVTSTTVGGHTHAVTVTCAATAGDGGSAGDGGVASGDASADGGSCNGLTASLISANHGHALVVPREDVALGATKTYSIKGTSSHPHDLTITSAQFAAIRAGESLSIVSSMVGGHTHAVTVLCA